MLILLKTVKGLLKYILYLELGLETNESRSIKSDEINLKEYESFS